MELLQENSVLETYKKAYECDPMSIFGGIVAFNKKVDSETAAGTYKDIFRGGYCTRV